MIIVGHDLLVHTGTSLFGVLVIMGHDLLIHAGTDLVVVMVGRALFRDQQVQICIAINYI